MQLERTRQFLVSIPDVAGAQNPDTGRLSLSSLLPSGAAATLVKIKCVWFDFITNATAGTRDMGIEVRMKRASDQQSLHVYSLFPSTSQPASKTWIWTFAPGLPNSTSAAGNSITAPLPDHWLPPDATFELDSSGPGGASDQFTNINLLLEVV